MCCSLFAQQDNTKFKCYERETLSWVFYDNYNAPILKQNIDSVSADSLKVNIKRISFNDSNSKLTIDGSIVVPNTASPWSPSILFLAGERQDSIIKGGFINDYTGVHIYDNPSIILTEFESNRINIETLKETQNIDFNITLHLKQDYDLLVIGKDACYGLLYDLKKIIKDTATNNMQ